VWLRALGSVLLGLFLYIGATLMFNNIITGTSDVATFGQTAVPVAIGVITVGIAAITLFSHS
jgi:hypothetical protein